MTHGCTLSRLGVPVTSLGRGGGAWFPSQNCRPPWPGPEKGNLILTSKMWRFISVAQENGLQRRFTSKFLDCGYLKCHTAAIPFRLSGIMEKGNCVHPQPSLRSRWLMPGVCSRKKEKEKNRGKKRTGTWSLWRNSVELLSLWLALLLQQSAASDTHLQVHYSRVQHPFFLRIRPPLHRVSIAAVWARARSADLTCGSDSHEMEEFCLELKNQQNCFWKTHLAETDLCDLLTSRGC